MTKPNLISFIVPILKSNPMFLECIYSIFSQKNLASFEVIIVNNGQDVGAKNHIRILKEKFATLQIINCKKKGPAAARNEGVKFATGQFLAFVDSDVVLKPDWAHLVLTKMNNFYDCAAAPIIPAQNDLSFLNRFRYHWRKHTTKDTFIVSAVTLNISLPVVNTAACIYRASLFRELGGFDESFIRAEDMNLSYRAYHYGCRFLFTDISTAEVYYFGNLISYCLRYFYDGLYSKNQTPLHSYITSCTIYDSKAIDQKYQYFYLFLITLRFFGAMSAKILKNEKLPDDIFAYRKCKSNLFIYFTYQNKKYYLDPEGRIVTHGLNKEPYVLIKLPDRQTKMSLVDFEKLIIGDTSSLDELKLKSLIESRIFKAGT